MKVTIIRLFQTTITTFHSDMESDTKLLIDRIEESDDDDDDDDDIDLNSGGVNIYFFYFLNQIF